MSFTLFLQHNTSTVHHQNCCVNSNNKIIPRPLPTKQKPGTAHVHYIFIQKFSIVESKNYTSACVYAYYFNLVVFHSLKH